MKKYLLLVLPLLIATTVYAQGARVIIPTANLDTSTQCPGNGPMNTVTINGTSYKVCNIGYKPLEPIPGITSGSNGFDPTQPNNLPKLVSTIFTVLITIAALTSVLSLVIGGVQYMTSTSAITKTKGADRARAALWGVLLIAGIWLILNTLNPKLLQFSLTPGSTTGYVYTPATQTNTNNTQVGTACSSSSGCASNQICAVQSTQDGSGTTQTCIAKVTNQACADGGGTWTSGWTTDYCYLPQYTTQQTCVDGGGRWYKSWGSSYYCYRP